jgi:hypothetical protein
VVALAAAAAALGVGAARADRTGAGLAHARYAPALTARAAEDNRYWSGYVVTGPGGTGIAYTSVTGTWTVPTVACTAADAGASSAIWVGLGGYNPGSRVLEQVGVNANCDASGKPIYFAWRELVPDIARTIKAKVFPGDTITGSVNVSSLGLVELQVKNRTRRWTFTQKTTWATADTSSAEWIMEAPTNCLRNSCHQARLANFGSVTMTRIDATGNFSSGTLTNPNWTLTSMRLVPDVSVALGRGGPLAGATAGKLSADGTRFDVSWVAGAATG